MSEIIDGWNDKPVNKIILSPGSRAWLHEYGLENHMYREEKFSGHTEEEEQVYGPPDPGVSDSELIMLFFKIFYPHVAR